MEEELFEPLMTKYDELFMLIHLVSHIDTTDSKTFKIGKYPPEDEPITLDSVNVNYFEYEGFNA